MENDSKSLLIIAFNEQGQKLVKVSEMRGHFDNLVDLELGFVQRRLVRAANPCSDFVLPRLAQVLKPNAGGELGLYAEGSCRIGEHNAYFHSAALLTVFCAALDQTRVPPGFTDLRDKVVELTVTAYQTSKCHRSMLLQGRLRPVKHAELLAK